MVCLAFYAVLIKHVDAVPESKERFIDVCSFDHSDSSIASA
jgi:hypothetical protein